MNELFSYLAVGLACWLARDSHGTKNMILANLVAADFLFFFAWDTIWFNSNIPGGEWMYSAKAIGGYLPFMLAYMLATTIIFVRNNSLKLGIYLSTLAAWAFIYHACYNVLYDKGLLGPFSDYQLIMGIHMALQLIGVFVGVKHGVINRYISHVTRSWNIGHYHNRGHQKHNV